MRESIKDLQPYQAGLSLDALERQLGRAVVRLSANESLWGPSPSVRNILQDAAALFGYYPDGAAAALKEALCVLWNTEASHLCIGNGTDEIIFMLAAAFLNPGEALIPLPTFSEYAAAVTVAGGRPVFADYRLYRLIWRTSPVRSQRGADSFSSATPTIRQALFHPHTTAGFSRQGSCQCPRSS